MTLGSLFSGIGGLDLGLERAGMRVVWQVENNPFCRKVLAKHWPDVPCYEDVKTLTGEELEPVDMVCAGFPCQPLSQAGKRKGVDDDRWLWDDLWRVALRVGCRGLLLENVPAILHNRRAMSCILGDLARHGWSCQWDCLSCAQVGGLHERKRWFCFCYPEVADSDRQGLEGRGVLRERAGQRATGTRCVGSPHQSARVFQGAIGGQWPTEADTGVLRISHGSAHRVDRLKAIGSAVCPQLAEWIGRRLIAHDAQESRS
jgi:DNA (cytosine-5)-methyltransferase 1